MPTPHDAPRNVVEALRGNRRERPVSDVSLAPGLKATLEDGIFQILSATPDARIVIRSSSLRQLAKSTDIGQSSHARIRGILVNQYLRLRSVGLEPAAPFDDALRAWRLEVSEGELVDFLDRLSADERARLATDVTANCVTLARTLGAISSAWLPRSSVRATVLLANGAVTLRDVIDLMVGTTLGDTASVALFDVTTSPLGEGAERSMRYHALVQTLRTGIVPLRTSVFSSATGEMWTQNVDEELLTRSVDDVLETLRTLALHA